MLLHHLTRRTILFVWAGIAVLGLVAGWLGYSRTEESLRGDVLEDTRRSTVAFDPANLRQLTGAREDVATPVYTEVKRRLIRLQSADPKTRFVGLYRADVATGKVVLLAGSDRAGAKDQAQPGDAFLPVPAANGLQATIRTGDAGTDGPLADEFGPRVIGYAAVGERFRVATGAQLQDLLALELNASEWTRQVWGGAFSRAFYVWVLLGAPFSALLVLRRQLDQREAIRNLSGAMEQSHSGLMIVDLGSRIEYVNRGLCDQIGYSRRELIGHNWRDFQISDTPAETIADLVATVRSGHKWEGEWFNRRKDGTVYPVHGVITPVKNRDGSLACFIAVLDDATEAKRREADLRDARDRAEAGDRAKGQFLATMSHEIRTPLNGIVGFTNLLLDTPLTPDQRDCVVTIRSSGESLIQLTSDILDYARVESGKLKLELAPCDPRECIEEALDLAAVAAASKKIALLHWIEDEVPAAIVTDAGRVRQVLVNLVNNAVKFTERGEVEVTVKLKAGTAPVAAGAGVTASAPASTAAAPEAAAGAGADDLPAGAGMATLLFTVRDSGIGIPKNQQENLFRPFQQGDSTSTRKYGGAGLGLAICRNLVQLLGGEISFTSEAGTGSVFSFTVQAPVSAPAAPPPDLAGLRLAIVAHPGPTRDELIRLARRWRANVIEADDVYALKAADWETALVEMDEACAQRLAAPAGPEPAIPPARTFGLVPMSLPSELRTSLRSYARLLINLPVHQNALREMLAGVRSAPVLEEAPPRHFGLRVMVVEDNPVNQRLMRRLLIRLSCTLVMAENGRRAVEELTQAAAPYDVILMDLHMPEMDGLNAIREIRRGQAGLRAQNIWIAVLTADAREEQRVASFAAGANDFLTKPMRLPELEAALDRYRANGR